MKAPRLSALQATVKRFAKLRVLVLGDCMLDEYLWGEVERISPEAPVPVVRVMRESAALGGAGNVARNITALGARCVLCGAVGADAAGETLRAQVRRLGIPEWGVVADAARRTTVKTRVEARAQQMLRFDRESTGAPGAPAARALRAALQRAATQCDAAIVEDYGKGLLSRAGRAQPLLRAAMRIFAAHGLPVYVDPKSNAAAYRGAALLKPNLREVRELTGLQCENQAALARAAQRLQRTLGAQAAVAITRGAQGLAVFPAPAEKAAAAVVAPALRQRVYDVQGAGDTVIAALTLARRAGANWLSAALIANTAAGIVVGKVGTAVATPEEICARLPEALAALRAARAGNKEQA